MQIVLARPRGFCAGVTRAIEIVERALAIHGAPVYVFHEIVHNGHVVGDLERQGFAVTVTGPDRFAAHIRAEAARWPEVVRRANARLE